jgi:CRISPR-associated protein Cas2
MTVIVMANVTDKIRGECRKYLIEIKAGVYIGKISQSVRELLWNLITGAGLDGGAIMAFPSDNEQGFSFVSYGEMQREVVDYDGISLLRYKSESKKDTKTWYKLKKMY